MGSCLASSPWRTVLAQRVGTLGRRAGWGVWGQAGLPLSQHGSAKRALQAPSPPPEPF